MPTPEPTNVPADVAATDAQGRTLYTAAVQGGHGARGKLEMAKVYYEKAVAKAPESALALVGLSDVVHVMGIRGFTDLPEAHRQAHELRLRALAMDDSIGELHTSLGTTFLYWEDEFEPRARSSSAGAELSPRNAIGRRMYGAWLKIAGRLPEALEEMRAAVTLTPEAPFVHVGLADVLMAVGRYDEASGPLRDALRLSPNYDAALERLEMSCHRAGLHEEALDARRSMLGAQKETERLQALDEDFEKHGWPAAREADLRRGLQQLLEKARTEDRIPGRRRKPPALRQAHHRARGAGRMAARHGLGGTGLSPAARTAAAGAHGPSLQPSRPRGRCPLRATAAHCRPHAPHLISRSHDRKGKQGP